MFFPLLALLFLPYYAVFGQTATHRLKADMPAQDEIHFSAIHQDSNGPMRYLRGVPKIETSEMAISADEIDYNSDTNWAYARGHVHLEEFQQGDNLYADHAEYNLKTEEGKFYGVSGTSPAKVLTSPGMLTTTNPFYFQASWAERIKNRYILHKGFVTDCKMPKPWWIFEAPVFDIIPGDRAIARRTVFRIRRVPILYLPYFYRPLGRNPRQSGFLTPNIGHSTLWGYVLGGGYYWAMNRSYDMSGVVQYYTLRGPAYTYDFRGKPNNATDFNFSLYGVQDRGTNLQGIGFEKEGGLEFEITARTQIDGFDGQLDYNYLSSYLFRQSFSSSFASAISSEVSSVGYLQRHFKYDTYVLNIVAQRDQLFESVSFLNQIPNQVVIQKLPSIEFSGREQTIANGPLPVWFSFNSSLGLLDRQEPPYTLANSHNSQPFGTGPMGRLDLEPRVSTAFSFGGFSLNPSVTFGATDYSNSYAVNQTTYTPNTGCGYPACPPNPSTTLQLANANLFRKDADLVVDLRLPPLERIYTPPKWLHLGEKFKHVIETDATYEYVTGINEIERIIHFDSTDILSNTNQMTVSLTNRFYKKDKTGSVSEVVTWRVAQARYFDPTFGGTAIPGQRDVIVSSAEISPYAFIDGPRNYSPVVSVLTVSPYNFFSIDWRAEYDPLRRHLIDQSYGISAHHSQYHVSVSDTEIKTNPLLVPQANQLSFSVGYGNTNRKGWNAGALFDYDLLLHRRLYDFIQASYNTDCCGFSFQIRQFNLGFRNETQYLYSFSVANLGTFGSLQKQERIF